VTTSAFSRQLLTNLDSVSWLSMLGVSGGGGSNSVTYDVNQFVIDQFNQLQNS
jgi:hypothetical protein